MRLVTYVRRGTESNARLGALIDDHVLDLTEAASAIGREGPYDSLLTLFQAGQAGLDDAAELVTRATANADAGPGWLVARSEVTLLPPLIPGKLIALGRNYPDHAAEAGNKLYEAPTGFVKCGSTLVGDEAVVPYPSFTQQLDYEVELAVVIGRAAKNVPAERALEYVVGYTIFNDLSARDWQVAERKRGNHLLGKNFDGSGPIGPALVTADEVPNPHDLELQLRVNSGIRQQGNTRDMIYDIPTQIAHWSRMTLYPGDILATGTPAGTASGHKDAAPWWLCPGDVVEAEIEKLGVLRTRIGQPA